MTLDPIGDDPDAARTTEPSLREAIEVALDELVRGLRADGADLRLVSVSAEGAVRLRLVGAHAECPMAIATLQAIIEATLQAQVGAVSRVLVES